MDFLIIYIDTSDQGEFQGRNRIVHTMRAIHTDVAALSSSIPDARGLASLMAVAVNMKTGKVNGYHVYQKTVADTVYIEEESAL